MEPKQPTIRFSIAVLAVVGLTISACASAAPVNDQQAEVESVTGFDDDAAEEYAASPLEELLGITSFDPRDNTQAELDEEERRYQELIATCMLGEGFEYVPINPSTQAAFFDAAPDDLALGSAEWIAKYGYGVTTRAFTQEQVGVDLVGRPFDNIASQTGTQQDPNSAYLATLSEAERAAYLVALHGRQIDPEAMTAADIESILLGDQVSGCRSQAAASGELGKKQDFFSVLGNEMEDLWEAMESDPRALEADAETERCVLSRGIEYVAEQDAWRQFEARLTPIMGRVHGSGDSDKRLSEDDKATLATLQMEEVSIAIAVHECGGGWLGQPDLVRELRGEYESRFLDENRGALEAFAASI